jgi:hypothetical protein
MNGSLRIMDSKRSKHRIRGVHEIKPDFEPGFGAGTSRGFRRFKITAKNEFCTQWALLGEIVSVRYFGNSSLEPAAIVFYQLAIPITEQASSIAIHLVEQPENDFIQAKTIVAGSNLYPFTLFR